VVSQTQALTEVQETRLLRKLIKKEYQGRKWGLPQKAVVELGGSAPVEVLPAHQRREDVLNHYLHKLMTRVSHYRKSPEKTVVHKTGAKSLG